MVEAAKETNNVGRTTLVQNDQLSHDLCSDRWLDVKSDQLQKIQKTVKM